MGKSLKEKAVMAMIGVIVLYAIAAVLWFVSAERSWKKASDGYGKAKKAYLRELKLIGEKDKWADDYEKEKAQMPTFDMSKSTETTWLRPLDALALTNRVVISSSKAGREVAVGDVWQLPISVSWEGSLEGVVRLLYQLENSREGMFDVSKISIRPSNKKGYLKGSFVLNCAYMKDGK